MALRKIEASVPNSHRQLVLDALTHEGGIGHETHVGEYIVCKECENCVVVMVVCVAARAGELMNVLTNCGVGVVFGTVTSIQVASHRPNPVALVQEFRDLKMKVEAQAEGALAKDRQFARRWKRRRDRLEKRKIEYISADTGKSVEELFNEIVDQSCDGRGFYVSVMCASVIAGVGLLTNSAVVVLSAMLISPLMGPILSSAFGLAIGDPVLFWGSIAAECRAAVVTFLMGAVVGVVYGPFAVAYGENPIPTTEMAGRGQTNGLVGGCLIAVASGVVVANAITSSGVNSLVGVAISASLLPPIVNSGVMIVFALGIAKGCDNAADLMCTFSKKEFLTKAGVSFALYAINVAVIIVVAGGIFYNQKIGKFRGFLVATETHELLDTANAHVRKKLQVATGIKGAVTDCTFDKLIDEASKTQAVRKADVENAPEDSRLKHISSEHVHQSQYSVLRPFDEPKGVKRAAFALHEQNAKIFDWVKDVHDLLKR